MYAWYMDFNISGCKLWKYSTHLSKYMYLLIWCHTAGSWNKTYCNDGISIFRVIIIILLYNWWIVWIIRICQPENSDVHGSEAVKEYTTCFVISLFACPSFLSFIKFFSFHINLLKYDVPCALKTRLFQQLLIKLLKLLWDVQKNCILKLPFS